MQVFKLYFKLLKSVSPALIIYGVVFAALIFMLSSNQPQHTINFEETKIKTALVNYNEENILVQDFIDYLGQFCEFYDLGDDEEDLADALFFREVTYIITIPYQFGEDFLLGKEVSVEKKTVPDGIYSTSVDHAINNYLNTANIYLKTVPNITVDQLITSIRQDLKVESNVVIETKNEKNDNYNFYNYYFNTSAYIMLSCCLLGVGLIMLSFHNMDLRRRNMVTPMTVKDMNLQLFCGNLIFVLGYDIFFVLFGIFINKEKMIGSNDWLFWLNLIVFSISALSISYLAAIIIKKKAINEALSYVLPLGLSFISGAFIPQILLGDFVLKLASFSPVYWFVKGNDKIAVLTNFDWNNIKEIYYYMAIQLGFAMALFALSLVISKNRMQGER
jgi:ABC-2 type transport system permease protein